MRFTLVASVIVASKFCCCSNAVDQPGPDGTTKEARNQKRQVWEDRKIRRKQQVAEQKPFKDEGGFGDSTNEEGLSFAPTAVLPPGDYGIRFSKVVFPEGTEEPVGFLPLTAENYPISEETATILRQTNCPSVVTPDDYECRGLNLDDMLNSVGVGPMHASSDPYDPFWDELRTVVDAQYLRREQKCTKQVMPLPKIWENYTLDDVAEAVHDEFPGSHHVEMIKTFLQEGLKVDNDVIPERSRVEFLRGPVMLSDLNTWSIRVVGPVNFAAKYYFGVARPEEIAFMIAQGQLTERDGVPRDLIHKVEGLKLQSAPEFTAYPEGSPMHPSFPAMHSAASSCSMWLAVAFNLTPEQICQARLVDFAVAYARTIAGVHYPMDNIAGLNLGQEVVAQKLADHLAEMYESDRTKVEEKIARVRFNWAEFDPWDCKCDESR